MFESQWNEMRLARCGPSHRYRHHHGGHRGPGGAHGFGPPHRGGRRGPGARRGAIRAAALLLLSDGALNGYQLMQELEERSGGIWRPSPGSVYPTLSQLEDEGLIEATDVDGKKAWALTDAGKAYLDERREKFGTPWAPEGNEGAGELHQLRLGLHALKVATEQVGQTGTSDQLTAAREVLDETRRALYRVLAEEPQGSGSGGEA